jgi:hypothetical protein
VEVAQGWRKYLRLPANVPQPVIYVAGTAIAAAVLIGVGVWFAHNNSSTDAKFAPAPTSPRGDSASVAANITTPPAPAAVPTVAGPDAIINGTLEKQDVKGNVLGWFIHDRFKSQVQVLEDDGNHFIRLTNKDASKTVFVDQKVNVDPHWKTVTISARIRTSDFKAGKSASQDARVALAFHDQNGTRVGNWPPVPSVKTNSPWTDRVVTADVPEGAKSLIIQLAIFNATGTADFDNIRVVPQEAQ